MALNYLLSPNFQTVSTGGKPATGGYLEVYIAGTRDKYFCCSDFSGTLHPFKIPLDALGSNIVLADEGNAYDVYIYNRYGSLMMSRYNVHPAQGGVISSTNIISTDGSITVTNTANGVDLSVTDNHPDVLVCTGESALTADGTFDVRKESGTGEALSVVSNSVHIADHDWYNYEAMVRLRWGGPVQNTVQSITVSCTGGGYQLVDFDMSDLRDETVTVSGAFVSGGLLACSVAGLPQGLTAELTKLSIFKISSRNTQQTGGGSDLPEYDSSNAGQVLTVNGDGTDVEWANPNTGKVHRLLRYYTNAVDADADHPAGDWLHDLDAEDQDDPSGHPMVTADQLFDWFGQGENFELYEIDSRSGQTGWSAVYRMTTWQDQSDWWSQNAPVPGKACRLEFHRMGYSATVNYASMIAYIRYKEEDYMRLYEIMPGQSVWTMELQPALPYYGRDTHNGEFLRVKSDGSNLEWAAVQTVTVDQNYGASSTNAQSGVAVSQAISGVNQVPASTSSDENKVLTVNSNGDPVWATPSGGGSSVTPYPAVGNDTLRFEFADSSANPSSVRTENVTWTQRTEDPSRNVWDAAVTTPRYGLFDSMSSSLGEFSIIDSKIVSTSFDFTYLFSSCHKLKHVRLNIEATPSNNSLTWMFYGCENLEDVEISVTSMISISDMSNMCSLCQSLKTFKATTSNDFAGISLSGNADLSSMFYACQSLSEATGIYLTSGYYNLSSSFNRCKLLKYLPFVMYPAFLRVSNLSNTFRECYNLRAVPPILAYTQNCTQAFEDCWALQTVPAVAFYSYSHIDCSYMFHRCHSLSYCYIVGQEHIRNASLMFSECHALASPPVTVVENDGNASVGAMYDFCECMGSGMLDAYNSLSACTPSTYTNCFSNAGVLSAQGTAERAQVPSSWGGAGA